MSAIANLDERCPYGCDKSVGDHTLSEWSAHIDQGDGSFVLPHEEIPPDPSLSVTIGDEQCPLADTIVARGATVGGAQGSALELCVPVMILDFQIGNPTGPPRPVTRIAYCASPEMMRKTGVLLRDTANSAANAAKRLGG